MEKRSRKFAMGDPRRNRHRYWVYRQRGWGFAALNDQIARIDRLLIAMDEFSRINDTPIDPETRQEQQAIVDELKELREGLARTRISQAEAERALVRLAALKGRGP